jgi:hypothetical protein
MRHQPLNVRWADGSKILVPLVMVLLTVGGGFSFAQISKLTDKSAFSDAALQLFSGQLTRYAEVMDVFAALGVRLVGEGGSVPTVEFVTVGEGFLPPIDHVIRNQPLMGTSADQALIFQFKYPLHRVGFVLGNGSESTVARIRALTAKGELLGTIEQSAINETRGPFVGLETTHTAGISTVILDYGAEEQAEQIHSLLLEYLSPRVFETYLPHIVHGRAGDRLLRTLIQIQDLGVADETKAKLSLFNQSGQPLTLRLNGQEGSAFEFTFTFLASVHLEVESLGEEWAVGHARIESSFPVAAHAIYQTSGPDFDEMVEAGVESVEAKTFHAASVERMMGAGLDTGIAVANVGETPTRAVFMLLEETGERPEEIRNLPSFALEPGQQRAFFLSEFCSISPIPDFCNFDFLAERDFRGAVRITSVVPIVVTTLRTVHGIPVSSLPVGSTER